MLEKFIPPTAPAVLFTVFNIARFENQRWWRARRSGLRGSSEAVGLFVDFTFFLGTVLNYAVLIYVAGWESWKIAIGLFAISGGVGLVYSAVSAVAFRGDSILVWMVSTLALWPIGGYVAYSFIG